MDQPPPNPVLDSPLPPAPPADQILSPLQWETLLAIADTIVPSIRPSASADISRHRAVDQPQYDCLTSSLCAPSTSTKHDSKEIAARYLQENATSIPAFHDTVCRILGNNIHTEGRRGISLILNALNRRALSIILTGYAAPFQSHPYNVREAIFRSWENSYLSPMRAIHRAFVSLTKKSWAAVSPTLPIVLDFPSVPVNYTSGKGFPYSFLQFPAGDNPEVIETDVVIVGSGCGGAVAAKNLAEAGHRVIVVEKSSFFPPTHYPMNEQQGQSHLFANGGAELSDDGTIAVLSGSTWGGGGTINWSACLQTQSMVRQEWANTGLPFFSSMAFQASLDRVSNYMGVSADQIEHNYGNKLILEGARKLGYSVKPVPQNTAHQTHYCGYCTMGCASCDKQSPAVSFLPDAARAGATFIERFDVERVLFGKETVDGKKVAAGIQGTWLSRDANQTTAGEPAVKRRLIIKAKKVVVSSGTLQSPLLLLRSGLKNPHLGHNLYLHPVIIMSAVYDDNIRPWEGGILTSVVNEFDNLDGQGHGSKVEALTMLPSFYLPLFPWKNGLDYKLFAAKLPQMAGFISLTRDRYPGRVYPDPVDGRCRIQYTPSLFDRKHMLEGAIGAAKIAYVSGAKEIRTTSRAIPTFVRPEPTSSSDVASSDEGINNAAFQAWIKEVRSSNPLPPDQTAFASAHQMGTCRMGVSPKQGVVDPTGLVWGTKGLYVIDASVFPSASGVNPMITNMALSDFTSRNLAELMIREPTVPPARL